MHLVRVSLSFFFALVVTLGIFFLMKSLITKDAGNIDDLGTAVSIRFGPVKVPDIENTKNREKPKKPPPPKEPPPPPKMNVAQVNKPLNPLPNLNLPKMDLAMKGSGPVLGGFRQEDMGKDGGIIPLVRIQPQYPPEAAIAKLEGYVKIAFTITETGTVKNPRVVEAEPARVFNRAAIRAILKWKFKPKVVDGVPVEQLATQVLEFKLDGST